MTKPDRYERMVLAEMKKRGLSPISEDDLVIWLNAPDIVKLLRREHAWMVRMVMKLKMLNINTQFTFDEGFQCALDDVMAALRKRKR